MHINSKNAQLRWKMFHPIRRHAHKQVWKRVYKSLNAQQNVLDFASTEDVIA